MLRYYVAFWSSSTKRNAVLANEDAMTRQMKRDVLHSECVRDVVNYRHIGLRLFHWTWWISDIGCGLPRGRRDLGYGQGEC